MKVEIKSRSKLYTPFNKEIFGSNEHMIRTTKINIKNRNTIKKNFSPNDTTGKNNLKKHLFSILMEMKILLQILGLKI
jgi:hypothetical protein